MDLISNLPDGVLCHILSFLTTKEAALTSILCKRWRNLFAFVPNLDFHDSFILYSGDNPQLFTDFVDRVLALQGNSPINKFSLNCVGVDSDRIDAWIRNVMVRGVSELKLSILTGTTDNYSLFPEIFESEKLVKLEIHNGDISLDGSIFLPMLKTLVLEYVWLSVDKFEILLHALPALEELALLSIRWNDWNIRNIVDVTVSSASLKTLTIDFFGSVSYTFDTPSLVYFCYSDHLAEDYSITKMENLLEARISLQVPENEIKRARAQNNDWLEDDEDIVLRFAIVGKLMNHIQNVQYLDLCPNTIEMLSLCCESLPVFNNLKSLTIKSHRARGWQAMPVLLRNCPHLETLVIEGLLHHFTDKCGDACGCVPRDDKGRSLTSCPVKVLDIKGFQGTMKEIYMIKHFLDYFLCLKEIKIFYEGENCPLQLRVPEMSEVIVEMTEHYNKKTGKIQYKKFALIVENVEKKKAERFSQLSQKDSGSASGSNHLSREEFHRLVLEETPVRKGRVFGLGRVLDTLNSASSSANFCDPELVKELQVMREQLTQKDAEIAELKSAVEFLKTYITENFQPPPGDSLPQ